MSNEPHDVTARAVVEFTRILYRRLSERFGGETTLNELRVINQVVCCHLDGRTCCVTDLHKMTGIPIPTVSRVVGHLQDGGWLSAQQDPDDGRRRIISLGPRSRERTCSDITKAIQWINDFREHGLTT